MLALTVPVFDSSRAARTRSAACLLRLPKVESRSMDSLRRILICERNLLWQQLQHLRSN